MQAVLRGKLAARFGSIYEVGAGHFRGCRPELILDPAENPGAPHTEAGGFEGSSRGGVATVESAGYTSVGRVWMAPSDMECMRSIGGGGVRVGR